MGLPTTSPDCSLINSPTLAIEPDSVASDVESLLSRNEGSPNPSTGQMSLDRPVKIRDFDDPDIEVWVNNTSFKTQRRLIKKFAALRCLIKVDQAAIFIESDECTIDDFYEALKILDAAVIDRPHFDLPMLISALKLATTYDHPKLREFAITELGESCLGLADRVQLAREYSIPGWEAAALKELSERDEPITEREANAIGLEGVVRVARIREHRISTVQARKAEDQHRPETGDLRAETGGWFGAAVLNELKEIRDQISSQGKVLGDMMHFGKENLQVSHDHYDFVMKRSGYATSQSFPQAV